MPEGDTVYRTARNLDEVLAGAVLRKSDFRVPKYATLDLSGAVIEGVASRGKHLLIRVGEHSIHSHLKMEGSWHRYRHGTKWRRPAYQARAVLETADWVAVGFDLGKLDVVARDDEESVVGYLGPDVLGADWDPTLAVANLEREPDREIGLALLDQRNLAGLGNIYRTEVLFLRGVLPTRLVRDVGDLPRMVELAHRLMDTNKDRVERSTTGNLRGATDWVYGREGRPCLRCGTTIVKGELGDNELQLRDTYYCPRCQT